MAQATAPILDFTIAAPTKCTAFPVSAKADTAGMPDHAGKGAGRGLTAVDRGPPAEWDSLVN